MKIEKLQFGHEYGAALWRQNYPDSIDAAIAEANRILPQGAVFEIRAKGKHALRNPHDHAVGWYASYGYGAPYTQPSQCMQEKPLIPLRSYEEAPEEDIGCKILGRLRVE